MKRRSQNARGYTLMEVLLAMTILAISLSILLGTQANSALMTERANQMALAALMARSKMVDIEGELLADGFSEMEDRRDGDFRPEGFPDMEWEALIEVIEIPPEAAPEFAASINSQLFGEGGEMGALSGSAAVSQWMPMILAEVPNFINDMAKRARFVTLTVSWPDGNHRQTLTVQQYVINFAPGGAEGVLQTVDGSTPGVPGSGGVDLLNPGGR